VTGHSKAGKRRVTPILSGSFSGPQINGHILRGGANWQLFRPDGVAEMVARFTMRTDDGIDITVVDRGLAVFPDGYQEQRARGELSDATQVYVRTTPVFEAPSDSAYAWLNKHIFVGSLMRVQADPLIVDVQIFKVL
jgi:hypothetical protein